MKAESVSQVEEEPSAPIGLAPHRVKRVVRPPVPFTAEQDNPQHLPRLVLVPPGDKMDSQWSIHGVKS